MKHARSPTPARYDRSEQRPSSGPIPAPNRHGCARSGAQERAPRTSGLARRCGRSRVPGPGQVDGCRVAATVGRCDALSPLESARCPTELQVDARRPQRNRIHFDATVPHDIAEHRSRPAGPWSPIGLPLRSGSSPITRPTRPASAPGKDEIVTVATVIETLRVGRGQRAVRSTLAALRCRRGREAQEFRANV